MPSNLSSVKRILSSKYTAIVIILIVSIGVYLNTLSNEFVYDDKTLVLKNHWIRDVKYIPEIFLTDTWAFKGEGSPLNFYRPLMHIIYMIDYHIFGLKPWGFHLTNVLFHAGVSVLVFLIFSMLINQLRFLNLKPKISNQKSEILSPAFIAALLFAAHPIHTEAVTCVAGIGDPSFTLFYLLSFYLYIYPVRDKYINGIKADGKWGKKIILSVFFFFLATLCKEPALTLPLLLLAYDYSISKTSPHTLQFTLPGIIKRYLPYLIASGAYFILRTYAIGGFAPLKRHAQLSNYEYVINIFPLFIQYLEKLILPVNLNAFHVFHPVSSILQWKGIIALILTLGFIFIVYIFRKHKVVFLSLLWIVIPLLPVLYIPALGENTFTERYLYLSSVGFVVLVSLTIERISQLKALRHRVNFVIVSMLIILTGLYSAGTIKRNYIWRDNYSLWTDTVEKSPGGYIPHNNLGSANFEQQRFEDAIKEYMIAIKLKPDYPDPHFNLALIYSRQKKFDEAIKEYMIALSLRPNETETHNNLGNVYFEQQRFEDAIKEYMIAIKLKPDYPDPHFNLALIYSRQKKFDEAIKEYMITIKLKPDSPKPHNDIGNIYAEYGRFDEAIREYLIALRLNPEDAETHNNIANAYMEKGEIDKAFEHYEIALKLSPDYVGAHYSLGLAYLKKGLRLKAGEQFKTALKLRPDFTPAREALKSVSNTP